MENLASQPKDSRMEILTVKVALKSEQAEGKGFDDAYFMDNEHLLEDDEIATMVAKKYPYVLTQLREKNKDKQFVLKWLKDVGPDKALDVYYKAKQNTLELVLSDEEKKDITGQM
jgi:hypothetical protein